MKFGGHHKGYAFVEFITKQEAQTAMENLSNTHLYGRHLVIFQVTLFLHLWNHYLRSWPNSSFSQVIERAKEKETMEDLRAKAAAHLAVDTGGPSKKRKQTTVAEKADKIARIV